MFRISIDSSLKWLLWLGRIFGLANLRDRNYDKFHLNYGNGEEACSLERDLKHRLSHRKVEVDLGPCLYPSRPTQKDRRHLRGSDRGDECRE